MRIAVLGGGPAGLYFASLWKARHPRDAVELFEQNPADATWGFGVVFSDRALEFLREDDPGTADLIAPRLQTWRDITIVHRGEAVVIDGIGFSAIGRLELLQLLQQRAREAGVALSFGRPVASLDELGSVRPDRRGRRRELAGAADLRGRLRLFALLSDQQVHLVRHHAPVRHADPDLRRLPTSAPSTPTTTATRRT